MTDTLAIILAGGRGKRLDPLSRDRAKPAVPFAGPYRIIDFTLSNCLNSGLRQVLVLTQYKSASLDRHIHSGWGRYFQAGLGECLELIPPQQRVCDDWYRGTADAVFQNLYSIERMGAKRVLILAGDHVYKMDYRLMLQFHEQHGRPATVACLEVPDTEAAGQFGVMEIDDQHRIVGFQEKPSNPKSIPGKPGTCLASMGIYVFSTDFLRQALQVNAAPSAGGPDFGHHLLPSIISRGQAMAHTFEGVASDRPYWRDVGTLDAYYQASMELLDREPPLNLYDERWPLRTFEPSLPPPRVATAVGGRDVASRPNVFCAGSIIDASHVSGSIIGKGCRIAPGAVVEDSILMDGVHVGPGAIVRRAILDKHVQVLAAAIVDGRSPREDGSHTYSENGVVCVAKEDVVGPIAASSPSIRQGEFSADSNEQEDHRTLPSLRLFPRTTRSQVFADCPL